MSRKDLQDYWEARDGYIRQIGKSVLTIIHDAVALRAFMEFKEKIETELGKKDARALRCLRWTAHIVATEGIAISEEIYPDRERDMTDSLLCMSGHQELAFAVYDAVVKMSLDAVLRLVPKVTPAEAAS
jgi:hypothetical protein